MNDNEVKRGRGQRGKGKGEYHLTPAARAQRKAASRKSAEARRTGTAWRCISVTEPHYFWATQKFGSVNNALDELRARLENETTTTTKNERSNAHV